MAANDFFVIDPNDTTTKAKKYYVAAAATAINPGEPVVLSGTPNYVVAASDGASTTQTWAGVATSVSTQTATADGVVYISDDFEIVYRGKATTPANLVTAVRYDKVTLDLTGSTYTIDENDTVNGVLRIMDFDATNGTVDFKISGANMLSN